MSEAYSHFGLSWCLGLTLPNDSTSVSLSGGDPRSLCFYQKPSMSQVFVDDSPTRLVFVAEVLYWWSLFPLVLSYCCWAGPCYNIHMSILSIYLFCSCVEALELEIKCIRYDMVWWIHLWKGKDLEKQCFISAVNMPFTVWYSGSIDYDGFSTC